MNPSPEMVEKARADRAMEYAKERIVSEPMQLLLKELLLDFANREADSAVREAVRELAPFLVHGDMCEAWDTAEDACTCGLDAIRKRFELE